MGRPATTPREEEVDQGVQTAETHKYYVQQADD